MKKKGQKNTEKLTRGFRRPKESERVSARNWCLPEQTQQQESISAGKG